MALRIFLIGSAAFVLMIYVTYLSFVNYFFIHFFWCDIIQHTLGGIWAGLIAAWFMVIDHRRPQMLFCIGFALFCGIAIEILEYYSGLGRSIFMPYPLDTAKDLVVDMIGGYFAWRIVQALKTV